MVPEPTDAGDGQIHGAIAQASLAQHRVRQDRSRVAILDHQHRQGGVAGVFGEDAIVHRDLRRITRASGGARARQVGHSAPYAALAPRPERHTRTFACLLYTSPSPRD
eukprot:8806807-Alexandrium_andersonii.AAC.1